MLPEAPRARVPPHTHTDVHVSTRRRRRRPLHRKSQFLRRILFDFHIYAMLGVRLGQLISFSFSLFLFLADVDDDDDGF